MNPDEDMEIFGKDAARGNGLTAPHLMLSGCAGGDLAGYPEREPELVEWWNTRGKRGTRLITDAELGRITERRPWDRPRNGSKFTNVRGAAMK